MNEAIDTLAIVAWGRFNSGLLSDTQFRGIHNALEALREPEFV